jgi:hypothetical protein
MTSPRTDFGTVVLHWLMVATLVVLLATGLRIAADEPGLRWLVAFNAVLPKDHLWYWHIVAGVAFSGLVIAYVAYVAAARLGRRTRLDRNRLRALTRPGPPRWSALGAVFAWVGLVGFITEMATGTLVYLGQAGMALALHRDVMWLCLALPLLHVAGHAAYGGAGQLLRIVRPTRLVLPPPEPDVLALLAEHVRIVDDLTHGRIAAPPAVTQAPPPAGRRRRPLLFASGFGLAVVAGGFALDSATGVKLYAPAIRPLSDAQAPVLDGDISDPIWASAPAVTMRTIEGSNFASAGASLVELRAVHDSERLYLAVTWEDPTRSLKQHPLVKSRDGWRQAGTALSAAREDQYAEDAFSILVSPPTVPLVGAAIHLTPRPLPQYPASASGRGLHYTQPGGLADVWVWHAARGGLLGYLDDAHFTGPQPPTAAQAAGKEPYAGGYLPDAGDPCFVDHARIGEGSRWWLTIADTDPYAVEADARIPIGTVIPSVLMTCTPKGDRADVQGVARWSAGHWTLELVRRLDTGSANDVPLVSGVMLWLAAFDHSATRHTRHLRPITLELM